MRRLVLLAMLGCQGCATAPAPRLAAQNLSAPTVSLLTQADPGALQTVGLFEHGCFPFIGNAALLRNDAALVQLIPMPPAPAAFFLKGHSGLAFGFSTPKGRRVLLSFDSGACGVSSLTVNANLIERLLLENIADAHGKISLVKNFIAPNGSLTIHIYAVAVNGHMVVVSFARLAAAIGTSNLHQLDIFGLTTTGQF